MHEQRGGLDPLAWRAWFVPLGPSVGRCGGEVGGGLDQLIQGSGDGLVPAGHHVLVAQRHRRRVRPTQAPVPPMRAGRSTRDRTPRSIGLPRSP